MTFTQNKKPSNTVSNNYPFIFYEKAHTKSSLGSKFKNKPQTAISGTKHTITTDKNKVIHRKLISNPIPFQNAATPTKRINTRHRPNNPPAQKQTKVELQPAAIVEKNHHDQKTPKTAQTG